MIIKPKPAPVGAGKHTESNKMKTYNFEAQGLPLGRIESQNIKQALNQFACQSNFFDWNDMLNNARGHGGNTVQVFVVNKQGYSTEVKHLKA